MAEEEQQADGQPAEGSQDEGVQRKDGADASAGPGSNNKLVFIVLIVNVVALVAVAAMFWMNASKQSQNVSLQDIEEQRQAEATVKDEAAEATQQSHYIDESFMVNLSGSEGKHFAKVDVSIQVENDFVKAELEKIRPKVRDFIVIMLSSKSVDQLSTADGVEFLREEIRNKINGYLTKGEVKDVLFTNFLVQ